LPTHLLPARYIVIGGFLGAGKTTAVGQLARHLTRQGRRVGLITNDQGRNLVDTALLRSQGFATEEIPGGCFCCRFNSLVEAAQRLTATTRPEVFIAEPVGSCTDLIATVTYPLRQLYGDRYTVAPVSVLLDPTRAARVFGLDPGSSFSTKVRYIYRKQIEEADLVVLSKSDLLDPARTDTLRRTIADQFPGKETWAVSARTGINLEAWFDRVLTAEPSATAALMIDYATYGEGEALLGWLNGSVQLTSEQALDANRFLSTLAGAVQEQLRAAQAEVAHLKMTLSPEPNLAGDLASVHLVRTDFVPELAFRLEDPVTRGQLLINLRAEAAPDLLAAVVQRALWIVTQQFPTLRATLDHLDHFRPAPPMPTHRLAHQPT